MSASIACGILLVATACLANGESAFHYGEHVVVLTNQTFDDTVRSKQPLLLKFFAPWCGHCRSLAPKYSELCSLLTEKQMDVRCAVFDASEDDVIAPREEIQHFPTVRLYKDNKQSEYKGRPEVASMMKWVEQKMGPPIPVIESEEELQKLRDASQVLFVTFMKSEEEPEAFKKLEELVNKFENEHPIIAVHDEKLRKTLIGDNDVKLMVFKKFDEPEVHSTQKPTPDTVKEFFYAHIVPLLTDFSAEMSNSMFSIERNLILFASNTTRPTDKKPYVEELRNILRDSARGFRGRVAFGHVNTDLPEHSRVLEFFDISKDDLPTIRLVKLLPSLVKFKYAESEMNKESIVKFIEDCIANRLQPHLKAQKLPENWDRDPVKVLVQSNFDAVTKNPSNRAVLVEFYAPWCGMCQRLEPVYEQVGKHFEKTDGVVIAKIDGTLNEIAGLGIYGFPTIMLFKNGTDRLVYGGNRTLESFIDFVQSGTVYPDAQRDYDSKNQQEETPHQHRKDEL